MKTVGQLAETMKEAIAIRDAMKEQGATPEAMDEAMERTLRAVWPFTREWHYYCDACQDTGLIMRTCRPSLRCNGVSTRTDGPKEKPGKYQRICRLDPKYEHDYGEPCTCRAGLKFRPAERSEEDFTQAGKTSKPTRFGR